MSSKKAPVIAFLIDEIYHDYHLNIARGAISAAEDLGVVLLLVSGGVLVPQGNESMDDNIAYNLVDHRNVDALLLAAGSVGRKAEDRDLEQLLRGFGPVPLLNLFRDIPGYPSLLLDNRLPMIELMNHLTSVHQIKRIAYIGGPEEETECQMRFQGYLDGLKQAGIPYSSHRYFQGDFSVNCVDEALDLFLKDPNDTPQGIVCANDNMAIGLINKLEQRGYRIPEDMVVTGFDDIPTAASHRPSLTSAHQSFFQQAYYGVARLVAKVRGQYLKESLPEIFPVYRQSCGCSVKLGGQQISNKIQEMEGPKAYPMRLKRDLRVLDISPQKKREMVEEVTGQLFEDDHCQAEKSQGFLDNMFQSDLIDRTGDFNCFQSILFHLSQYLEQDGGDIKYRTRVNSALHRCYKERSDREITTSFFEKWNINTMKTMLVPRYTLDHILQDFIGGLKSQTNVEHLYLYFFHEEKLSIERRDFNGEELYLKMIFSPGETQVLDQPRITPLKELIPHEIRSSQDGGLYSIYPLTFNGRCYGIILISCSQDYLLQTKSLQWNLAVDLNTLEMFQQQQRSRIRTDNIINSIHSQLIGVDREGRVLLWNQRAMDKTGITPGNARGQTLTIHPHLDKSLISLIGNMHRDSEQIRLKKDRLSPLGDKIHEEIVISPLQKGSHGGGAVIRIDDVSEQVKMEEMMLQSEKMLSIGGLAAGMAHEINNPLGGMMQTAHVLESRLTDTALNANVKAAEELNLNMGDIQAFMEKRKIPDMVKRIIKSGKNAAEIVQNMLSFAQKSQDNKALYDMAELVDQCLELSRVDYNLKKNYDFQRIEIIRNFDKDLPEVLCSNSKIQQVILNLLKNAAEAMWDDKRTDRPPPRIEITLRLNHNLEGIILEIQDNGPGIDWNIQKRVFEPFFTTKPPDRGTGLGLSVSYFIIQEDHRGRLSLKSSSPQGSCFSIELPLYYLD